MTRPDPLAPPEGYGADPAHLASQPLDEVARQLAASACSFTDCMEPVVMIAWLGCRHEHVGPVGWCRRHKAVTALPLVCGRCGGQVKIMRTERLD